jgi:hypothetical protein
VRTILVVPQCCEHCTREENLSNAERFELTYQLGEFYNRSGRVFNRRNWCDLRQRIGTLGYPIWIETDDPETVRKALGLAEGDHAVRPLGEG